MGPKAGTADRGILQAAAAKERFTLARFEPSPELAPFVEHYWVVRWDLTGLEPYSQTILSYPSVNISFEQEASSRFTGVYGVPRKTFTRTLRDWGAVLGIKFRPGGFYPFFERPVSLLTGQVFDLGNVLGCDPRQLEDQIFDQDDDESMARECERFFLENLPETDANVELVQRIVQAAIDDRSVTRVAHLTDRFDIGPRTMQRLFDRYVGVSPKWVVQRYRLQEAALLLEQGGHLDGPAVSQELGFYDQAHFIKQFKALVGITPDAYARLNLRRP